MANRIECGRNENFVREIGIPPPPWSIGIKTLQGNGKVILGLQSVAGKILAAKELEAGWGSAVICFDGLF